MNLDADLKYKMAYFASVMYLNFSMNSMIQDLFVQFAIGIIIVLKRIQTQTIQKVFFQVIQSLKEEIQNNTNYVAGVVHDLRNPLTEIYSCSELLG